MQVALGPKGYARPHFHSSTSCRLCYSIALSDRAVRQHGLCSRAAAARPFICVSSAQPVGSLLVSTICNLYASNRNNPPAASSICHAAIPRSKGSDAAGALADSADGSVTRHAVCLRAVCASVGEDNNRRQVRCSIPIVTRTSLFRCTKSVGYTEGSAIPPSLCTPMYTARGGGGSYLLQLGINFDSVSWTCSKILEKFLSVHASRAW